MDESALTGESEPVKKNAACKLKEDTSIGDLINDTTDRYTKYSILLDLEITKDGKTGKTKITGFSYTPIFFCYEDSGVRILRIREAMAAYESNNLSRVSKETYEEMAAALKRIESRVSK